MERLPLSATVGKARVLHLDDVDCIRADSLADYEPRPGERLLLRTRNSQREWWKRQGRLTPLVIDRHLPLVIDEYGSVQGLVTATDVLEALGARIELSPEEVARCIADTGFGWFPDGKRLAVVGELSASLAHEIRNPLTGVRSLAQRLAEEEIPDDKRRRYASVILEEVGRVERLVANLLGIAKRAPRVRDADARTALAPLFDDLALLVTGRAEKAGVRVTVDAHGATAHSAREPLAQALLNLLLNAVEHTPAGGAVSLIARTAEDGTAITVRDGGPGVPGEQRERIWEPFHTGGGGTGLGLAVVRRVAREEGWTVDVDDAPGGGAEFRILIPAAIPVDGARPVEPLRAAGRAALILIAFAATPLGAQTAMPPSHATAAERAAALRDSVGVPGLAVAVAVAGQVVWGAGYGWASVEDSVRATPSTVFGIGSVFAARRVTTPLRALWQQQPHFHQAHSAYLIALQHHPDTTEADLFDAPLSLGSSGDLAAIIAAISRTPACMASRVSYTWLTNPMRYASSALIISPVNIQRSARPVPTRRGRRCVPPPPGRMPSFTSG